MFTAISSHFWNAVAEGQGACGTAMRNAQRVIVQDVAQSPFFAGTPALQVQKDAGVRAVQSTPLVSRSGNLIGMLSTHWHIPHRPAERDLQLLDLLVQETVEIIESARVEEALRDSEARYHTLFETMIEGFCIIEVLFDTEGRPIDYRFLEINPAFEAQTGLRNAQGKRMCELEPDHEAHWFEIYGRVALTGEPARFVNEAKALNRWYDVSAYRLGGPESRKVGILFNDITARKKVEGEIQRHVEELTRFNRVAVDRELRMIELKKQVNELCAKAGLPPAYRIEFGKK